MAAWSGFSDAEIRRMRSDSSPNEKEKGNKVSPKSFQKPAAKQSQLQKNILKSESKKYQTVSSNNEQISDAMRLIPSEKCRLLSDRESPVKELTVTAMDNEEDQQPKFEDDEDVFHEVDLKFLDEKEVMSIEMKSIEVYQKKQREMEDHNKKKKQLLVNAIEERRRQASRESSRLGEIQHDLTRLDSLLSGDVGILRDRIENASREFMDAQKRYEKAEQEFVAAKLDLHHKAEIKQGLTEHLHIIIHKNELRRSRKLGELMTKLDLDSSPDTDDVILNPAQSLMTSIQTLGPTGPGNPNKILLESLGVEAKDKELSRMSTDHDNDDETLIDKGDAKNSNNDDVTALNCDSHEPPLSRLVQASEISDTESNTDSPSNKKVVRFVEHEREFVRELSV